ncbi:glucoamylase family protein [Bacillota bacterium Lsc_1132]
MKSLIHSFVAIILLVSFAVSPTVHAENNGNKKPTNEQLIAIAKKTFQFYRNFTDPRTGLTVDEVRYDTGKAEKHEYTSPTNISMYLFSTISANKLGIITKSEAIQRIQTTLDTLQKMKKWNGLFYNWYYTSNGSLKTDWGQFISTVDNGWLSAGLITVGQAFPEFYDQTSKLVSSMKYSLLYDPAIGQFHGGYDVVQGSLTAYHFGMFYTEPRVASYIAIGKGDVPEDHWWKMYRTLPADWDWQSQVPEGQNVIYDGIPVFEGHYSYKGIKYVPSWGGSMFEALMPSLVLKERELGINGLGLNNKNYVSLQITYAKDKGYPAWGISPSAIPNGYDALGVTPLGTSGYHDISIVTPHASFLALEYAPEAVIKNIHALKDLNTYGKYGFYDSVNVQTGEVAKAYLSLDQGMIMTSIANFVKNGVIRNYFNKDNIGKQPQHLLSEEVFSIGN